MWRRRHGTDVRGRVRPDEQHGPLTVGEAAAHMSRAQEVERQTLDYMATMPAWHDHPRVIRREA
jgi:hypothetical protein